MPEEALTTFTVCDAYRYFAGRTYLLPTDCIIVLDSYFNFTKKSYLVGNL